MNDNFKNRTPNKFVVCFFAWGFGGYIWGFLSGILNNFSFHQSISFAGHTLLSGGVAGLLGYSVFRFMTFMKSPRSIACVASPGIAGAVFCGATDILIKLAYRNSISIICAGNIPRSFFAGFIGGVAGGIVYVFMQRFLKNKSKTI